MNLVEMLVVPVVCAAGTFLLMRHWLGFVSRREHQDCLNTLTFFKNECVSQCARADRLALELESMALHYGTEKNKSQAALDEIAKLRIAGNPDCPHCRRLKARIRRYRQCDPQALVDAERYLLVDDDNEIRTFGEIRDAEIERALRLTDVEKTPAPKAA